MKFTKRITSLLLVFILASASLFTYVQAANFSDVNETNPYYGAINELVASGVINGYEDGTFKPENTITRAEFSKLLAVSSAPMGYLFTANTTTFSDILNMDADHGWAVPYIAYAVSTKAVNGYTDGTFKPGNPVTYGEAVKMIVCTLGYGSVTDTTLTPWYQGYLNIAQQIGLNKGAVSTGDAPASRGIVAQLIYNMLDCPVLVQTGVDQNGQPIYSTEGNTSFGDEKDNATSDEGVVLGFQDYSLDGSVVGRNKIRIYGSSGADNYVLGSGLSADSLKAYMGCTVSFSYNGSNNNKEIIKITPVNGYNTEVTVNPEDIEVLNDGYTEYYADDLSSRKDERTKITYNYPYVIYNGVPVNPTWKTGNPADWTTFVNTYLNLSNFDAGSVKFLSNDSSDNNAEVIIVEKFETYFVNSPATSNGDVTIYDKNSSVTGLPNLLIDADDATDVTKVSSKGGKPASATLSAITNKSVVSIAVPYGAAVGQTTENTKLIISTATVTGDVVSLNSDYTGIKIASGEYELSPYYKRLMANAPTTYEFNVGDNAKFYLDYLGRIVFMEKNQTSDPYGLIIAYSQSSGINSSVKVKLLTTSNSKVDYTLKSELKVDGIQMSAAAAVTALEAKRTVNDPANSAVVAVPVIYKLVGAEITSIQTLDTTNATVNNYLPKTSLKYYTSGRSFKTNDSAATTKFTMLASGTGAANVFVIPNAVGGFDAYSKKTSSYFQDGKVYEVAAYEMNGSTNAKIVLCYLTSNQTTTTEIVPSTNVYVVESISDVQEGAKKIAGKNIFKDEAFEKITNTESAVLNVVSTLQPGDLIRFVTEDDKICDIELVYSANTLSIPDVSAASWVTPNHHFRVKSGSDTEYYQVIYGTVYDTENISANQLQVIPEIYSTADLTASILTLDTTADTKYFKCYIFNNDTKIESSSAGELRDYDDAKTNGVPADASKVVVVVMRDKVQAVYIDQR